MMRKWFRNFLKDKCKSKILILFDIYIRTIDFVIDLVEEDFDDGLFDIIKRLI